MNSKGKAACDRYDRAEGKLKSFTRSAVRTKVMLCLMNGGMDAGELEDIIGLRASTILHSVKEMIDSNLVKKADSKYLLTNIGRIQALFLDNLLSTIAALDQHYDFWASHDLSGIPDELLSRIGLLDSSMVMKDDPTAPLKSLEHFISEMMKSKEVRGISPVIVTGYPETMSNLVHSGTFVELILTQAVLEIVSRDYRDTIKDLLKRENFRLYKISNDIRISFTVTETFLNLGLSRLDGTYDLGSDLICMGEGATAWGRELFQYYRDRSTPVHDIL
jgi:predicted transcriptional regulator